MDEFMEYEDTRLVIKNKLRQYFDGKIVRKDLTKHIKEGANVPVMFWSSFSVSIAVPMMKKSSKRASTM